MSKSAKNLQKSQDKRENAVVYCRYSSNMQSEQSIEGQIAAAQKYADAHHYTIIHQYIDRAKTGTNDNRDQFQQMLSDCAKHQFTVIIVWKVDRFGRNREEITFNKYRAKKQGVRVEYVAENISQGPEGVILESVLEGMAEYFSLQLAQNVSRGLLETAKKHHHVGGVPPLGYKLGPENEYEIDEKTAPIVRVIFDKYVNGMTQFELMEWLNDQGYTTSRGKPFTKNSLPYVLKNEKYIGTYIYAAGNIHDEDAIPAIIDKETFYKAQEMLKTNKRAPSHKWSYSDYILTDKLFCGHCGAMMIGTSGVGKMGQKYSYYYCANHRNGKKTCSKKPVRADWIEDLVIKEVCRILNDPELFNFIVDQTYQYYLKTEEAHNELDALIRERTGVIEAISNLTRAVEQGMPYTAVKTRMDELNGQQAALDKSIAEKQLEAGFKITREQIEFFLDQFRQMDLKDRKCQRRMVETFVNAIFVYDDKIRLTFNFGGDDSVISLKDLSDAEFVCCAATDTISITYEHPIMWCLHVIVIDIKIAPR